MHRCLQLAALGAGDVVPNPMVGAVLVHDNTIIGEGYHQHYGHAHAEVNCINNVPGQLRYLIKKSTLYVSLEPCSHFGKTPPCADLIIEHGIPRVVIGCTDSSEKINGGGIKKLRDAGVNVVTGILEPAATELNKRFFTFHKKQRPYIILKWAQSSNSKIANEDHSMVKISNELTNRLVHKWRSEEAAIMVGTRTAFYDNPSLTTRLWPGNNTVRIVIDKHLKLPLHLHLFDQSARTIILNMIRQDEDSRQDDQAGRGRNNYYKIEEGEDLLAATLNILRQRNLTSLIVEGGTVLLQSFIDSGCWDEARVISNEALLIENGIAAPVLKNKNLIKRNILRTDEICYYNNTERSV